MHLNHSWDCDAGLYGLDYETGFGFAGAGTSSLIKNNHVLKRLTSRLPQTGRATRGDRDGRGGTGRAAVRYDAPQRNGSDEDMDNLLFREKAR